jgi:hypothetical protein
MNELILEKVAIIKAKTQQRAKYKYPRKSERRDIRNESLMRSNYKREGNEITNTQLERESFNTSYKESDNKRSQTCYRPSKNTFNGDKLVSILG